MLCLSSRFLLLHLGSKPSKAYPPNSRPPDQQHSKPPDHHPFAKPQGQHHNVKPHHHVALHASRSREQHTQTYDLPPSTERAHDQPNSHAQKRISFGKDTIVYMYGSD